MVLGNFAIDIGVDYNSGIFTTNRLLMWKYERHSIFRFWSQYVVVRQIEIFGD